MRAGLGSYMDLMRRGNRREARLQHMGGLPQGPTRAADALPRVKMELQLLPKIHSVRSYCVVDLCWFLQQSVFNQPC